MKQCWDDEMIKIIMYFDNGLTYETQTHSLGNNSIVSFRKREVEQVNYTNLFGSISSNEISIRLFDVLDRLNISNTESPYYRYMRQGVKIEAYISYLGGDYWQDYGTYYVESWSGVFSDGLQDIVQINAVDEMKYILNNDMPKLDVYSAVNIETLIKWVLSGCGVDAGRVYISPALDTSFKFGVTEDVKVGYFLNEVCQALCAVINITNSNMIKIVPALASYGNQYDLSSKYIESIENLTNTRNIYTKVKCLYDKRRGSRYGSLLYDNLELNNDEGHLNVLRFNKKALNIKEIRVESDNLISFGGFMAYDRGMDAVIGNIKPEEEVNITVSGDYITSSEKYTISDIEYADIKNNRSVSYETYNKYIDTEAEAQAISDKLARFIELNNSKVRLRTIYTPKITLGDILTFSDSELLKGSYKVIGNETSHGTSYEKILTLIKYDGTVA